VRLKNHFGFDDSLDVVGVHGVGGLLGTLLVAIVGLPCLGGFGIVNWGKQLGLQAMASGITIVYTAVATALILLVVKKICKGLRVESQEELVGLDQSSHGESAYQ